MKIAFGGRVLIVGCGSVSRCLLPLILRHVDMDFSKLAIMDFEDLRHAIPDTLAAGAQYLQDRITSENLATLLEQHIGAGDLLIDLAWNIDTGEMLQWCHDHQALYLNTSVEIWDPYTDAEHIPPAWRTLYSRHMSLRKRAKSWLELGPTAVVEHGANPGLVNHWAKIGLEDIANAMLPTLTKTNRRVLLERALSESDYAHLAMSTGTRVIHISRRDSQISVQPKEVGEFVNTWSVPGLQEESVAPVELGWGTHERRLPPQAQVHTYGPGNQICLARIGVNTWVRSWVPSGEIAGLALRHGASFMLSDLLTVWDGGLPIYRPTVCDAYLPCDSALASLTEFKMSGYQLQARQRIMTNDIVDGKDELGVLLLGHDLNGWWVGSRLDIQEARRLVPNQNATALQTAASILGALTWMVHNPAEGFKTPDELPHREVLQVARPYLGPSPSIRTDWMPLKNRVDPFGRFGRPRPPDEDVWQFETFLV
jgi:homospermidine synthase